ncbi:MerR family transcriptional regulator [Micrococcus luteus]|uniref:MerR family transcriptional regulator n=1 Tax=Micrococcus luteus TaxID=1270 RepID=UPI001910C802|nr:MerR family transcriptional regulator [Micrococcus luteus]QQE49457.1 MerR family transcriptional regulator [Micrococcus luteus]
MKHDEAQAVATLGGTMQIGEVAERTQLSLRTIRHYDQVGLVPPSARSEGGFRLYTEADVERLNHARRITPLGFSLEETAEILSLLEGESAAAEVGHYLQRAREAREKLARKLRQADELIESLTALTALSGR